MSEAEIFTDQSEKQWKIVTLPDKSGGETVLVYEIEENQNGRISDNCRKSG